MAPLSNLADDDWPARPSRWLGAHAGVTNPPDWDALTVDGPQEFTDANGTTWFGFWATLTTPEPVDSAT